MQAPRTGGQTDISGRETHVTTTRSRLARGLAAAAALLTVAGAVSAANAAPLRTDVDGPGYQRPAVGTCHNYGIKVSQGQSDPTPTVSCSKTHTAVTTATFDLPAELSWPTTKADEDAFYDELYGGLVLKPCATAARKAWGASYRVIDRTAYNWTFYWPTKAQRAHGARWMRCDANLFGGTKLQALPKGSSARIGKVSASESLCRVSLGKGQTAPTGCSAKHDYRFTKLVRSPLKKWDADKLYAFGDRKCAPKGKAAYWIQWPSVVDWADGDRYVTCLVNTKH